MRTSISSLLIAACTLVALPAVANCTLGDFPFGAFGSQFVLFDSDFDPACGNDAGEAIAGVSVNGKFIGANHVSGRDTTVRGVTAGGATIATCGIRDRTADGQSRFDFAGCANAVTWRVILRTPGG